MCQEQEVLRQATEAADGGVPQNEIPAPVWTSDWSELCRARLEARLGRVSGPSPMDAGSGLSGAGLPREGAPAWLSA